MEQQRKIVAIYTCNDSKELSSEIHEQIFEKLEEWALKNERRDYFSFERFADSSPVDGVPYTENETRRMALQGLTAEINDRKIELVVTDDLNVLAKSPLDFHRFISACVKHKVPVKVMAYKRSRTL